jgi:hypothetical protein
VQPDYSDILSRIAEPPLWWFNGVPRYEPFAPRNLSVGPEENALVLVACQGCDRQFVVGIEPNAWTGGSMLKTLANGDFNVGDPPRHLSPDGLRCAGETMGTVPLAVLQAWRWEIDGLEFVRQPQFEGPLSES